MGVSVVRVRAVVESTSQLDEVYPLARQWAQICDAALVIRLLPGAYPRLGERPPGDEALLGEMRRRVEAIEPGGSSLDLEVQQRPFEALATDAASDELLVLPHPSAAGPRARLAMRVLRKLSGPVLFARHAPHSGRVLAATDLSDPDYPALRSGWKAASFLQAKLTALHCVSRLDELLAVVPLSPFDALPAWSPSVLSASSRRRLEAALEDVGVGQQAEALILEQAPAQGILRTAAEARAELLVVGQRVRSLVDRIAFGSVPETIVRRAPCPVMVVPLADN